MKMEKKFVQNKEKRLFNWAYRDELDLPDLREAIVGDMFAAKSKETGEIEACYIKAKPKGKRSFQCLDEKGYVSPYDMECMHPDCDFVWYAQTKKEDHGSNEYRGMDIPNPVDYCGF